MSLILPVLLYNLQMIAMIMIILVFGFIANTILGITTSAITYHNFDWKVMVMGIAKGLAIALGIFFLTAAVSIVPPIFALYEITFISAEIVESISIIAVLTPILLGAFYYIQGAIQKLRVLFGVKGSEKNDKSID